MKGLYFNDNNAFSTLHYRRKHELAENADRLPRDAMHKRGLCRAVSVCVCLSIRPSVTFVSCAETNKDIFEIFFTIG